MKQYLLVIIGLIVTTMLPGQIEVNPYVGWRSGSDDISIVGANDGVVSYTGDQWTVGADFLFGARQLAPLAGLLYRPGAYDGPDGESFAWHRFSLPLGVAYRVIAPDWDINLVPSVALLPGAVVGDDYPGDRRFDLSGRAGATLFLDFVSLGTHYVHGFTDHFTLNDDYRRGWMFTLGLRY